MKLCFSLIVTQFNIQISRDGFVSFSEYARYVSSRKFTERDSKNVNAAEDYPFIAPFYYGGADLGSTLTGNSLYKGKIFYNVLMKGNPRGQRELREIGRNVSSSIPGVSSFDPTYALVITWEKVTDQYNTGILKCTDEPGRMCQVHDLLFCIVHAIHLNTYISISITVNSTFAQLRSVL